jgi:putative ABC transport system permease protein
MTGSGIARDIRFAVRTLRRSPAFTLTAVLMLALGIGVNAMVFTVTSAVLFNGFPLVNDNDRIIYVTTGVGCCVSYPDFLDWRAQATSFTGMEMVHGLDRAVRDENDFLQRRTVTEVTAGTFRLAGQEPILGRDFLPSDEAPGAAPVAILRYEFWERQYGKRADVIGRTIRIDNIATTIVGVMPRGFAFPQNEVMWIPMAPTLALMDRGDRNTGWFAFGRLVDGATIESARAEMGAIGRRLGDAYPQTNQGRNLIPQLYDFREFFIGGNATLIYQAMLGAVSFVLLIACANLANLLLARALGRSREISVRLALGARRWQIVRQLLVESALLSTMGGLCGWWFAQFGLRIYSLWVSGPSVSDAIINTWFDGMLDYTMDYRVFVYLVSISVASGILFGLAPAARLGRLDVNGALKDATRGSTGSRRGKHLSGLLVVGEVALAVVLLAGAGVMIRSFLKIYMADIGVEAENLLVTRVTLPPSRYVEAESRVAFFEGLSARVEALPGVESVALASTIPTDRLSHVVYEVSGVSSAGAAIDDQQRPTVSTLVTGPSYFATLGVRIVEGREFTLFDGAASAPVVVVNERFASSTWPGERALGKRLRLAGASDEWMTVVGVVGNIAQNDRMRQTMDPVVYLPFRQSSGASMAVFARTRVPPSTLVTEVRRQIRAMDSELIPSQPQSLTDILAESYQYRGISGAMFLLCAVIALLLAAIGLYAVIMHSVTQRTQEIGLRIAIGATTGDIRWLVVREGVLTVGLGLAIGVAVSLFVNRLLVSSLVQVSPADPGTYTVVCTTLVLSTAIGCWLPARRAMRLDPVVALQQQ